MGRPLVELPALVLFDRVPPVDVQVLVRIHGNNHLPNKGVNPALLEPVPRNKRQKSDKCRGSRLLRPPGELLHP